jgi:hypothetical protein
MPHDFVWFRVDLDCSDEELGWFREHLRPVLLPDPRESGDDRHWLRDEDVPAGQATYESVLFLKDHTDREAIDAGFAFEIDEAERKMRFQSDEAAEPQRLARLLNLFLERFRPAIASRSRGCRRVTAP